MSAVFRQSLALIEPDLGAPLFPTGSSALLHEVAAWLTADVRIGLECRLDDSIAPVDLSQMIDVRDGGAGRLHELAVVRERKAEPGAQPIWRRIQRIASAAASGEASVDSIWLEYDVGAGLGASTVPSVFANLAGRGPFESSTLLELLQLLGAEDAHGTLGENLARAAEGAAAFGGRLHGIAGVMLARKNQSRVMILGLPSQAAVDYLLSIGWRGDVREVAEVLEALGADAATVNLSLELTPALEARVGLELALDHPPVDPGRRGRVLDVLVSRGLCTAPKRDALLSWAAQLTPANAPNRWPESLLLESLFRAPDEFGVFQRTLHHVKVAAGGGRVVAKAYLGFVHTWLKPSLPGYAHVV